MDNFEIITNWKQEVIFHKSLQANQKALKGSMVQNIIFSLNHLINKSKSNINSNKAAGQNNACDAYTQSTSSNIYSKKLNLSELIRIHNHNKKNFANRIFGFLRMFKFDDEQMQESNFVIIKKNWLINNMEFSTMMNDFSRDNNIEDANKFLTETLSLIEEYSRGRILEDNESIEFQLDEDINDEIIKMLLNNPDGLSFYDIFDRISKIYNNFFMNDYIKFIIDNLIKAGKIHSINQNFYQIL